MAKDMKVALATRQAALNAGLARCDGGKVRLYGAPKPANADAAVGAAVLLSEHNLAADAFADVNGAGDAVAGAIASDLGADATGDAAWARWLTAGGLAVFDCTVGGAAQGDTLLTHDLLMNNKAIQIGAQVDLTGFSVSQPA